MDDWWTDGPNTHLIHAFVGTKYPYEMLMRAGVFGLGGWGTVIRAALHHLIYTRGDGG